VDFNEVLMDKNSATLVDKILEILAGAISSPDRFQWGSGQRFRKPFLNLSGIFNDARQKMNS